MVAPGQVSISFATSMLHLQSELCASALGSDVHVERVGSVAQAVALARERDFDALAWMSAHLSFPAKLVTRALAGPHPFVAGVHPLPTLDWGAVTIDETGREELRFKGNTYNVDVSDLDEGARVDADGYTAVRRAGLGIAVLKREAIEAVAHARPTSDEAVCAAWGREVAVDLAHPCAISGNLEFAGCVGLRGLPPVVANPAAAAAAAK